MQFSSKEDIEAPIEQVFAVLTEFESYERSAIRRGVEVDRVNDIAPPRAGITWTACFSMRGKQRNVQIELATFDPPQAMTFEADSQGLEGVLELELVGPWALGQVGLLVLLWVLVPVGPWVLVPVGPWELAPVDQ